MQIAAYSVVVTYRDGSPNAYQNLSENEARSKIKTLLGGGLEKIASVQILPYYVN